ncbi:uncharacterized protein UDID_18471 [Ustilago sp. UG-2017a]|nr:uncharacterized protein UDID_18471 [Ustilago sp. UG-2017a]
MVCYSDKQALLNDIVHTLELSIPAEIKQNTDRVQHSCSTDIDDLEDNGDPLLLSRHLQTEAFQWNYSSSGVMSLNRVQEILLVALYRLGHSGNGGGKRDAALQCGCGVGSIVGYTNCTIAGLLELNNDVMQFASEGERQHAAAWVHNTTGVEEWGKGWLVVDGTHIPLAWKPGVLIGPFSHIAADKSYHGNIYCVKDRVTAAETIQACIVAHTFASQYERPADIANLLLPSFSEDEVREVAQSLQLDASDTQELRRTKCTNQQEDELDLATATQGMSQYAVSRLRSSAAHDLREEMLQVLFRSTGRNEEDTTALSRRHEKTTVDYNAMTQSTSARRQE